MSIPVVYVLYCVLGYVALLVVRAAVRYWRATAPRVVVPIDERELRGNSAAPRFDVALLQTKPNVLHCWDPATMEYMGEMQPLSAQEVRREIEAARVAQREWTKTSFETRRRLLRTMLRFMTENCETMVAGKHFSTYIYVCIFKNIFTR